MTQSQSLIVLKDAGDIEMYTLDDPNVLTVKDRVIVPHDEAPWLAFELLREKYSDHVDPVEFQDWCEEHAVLYVANRNVVEALVKLHKKRAAAGKKPPPPTKPPGK
jgi:hypothetical protein